jgi:hypothetical protein
MISVRPTEARGDGPADELLSKKAKDFNKAPGDDSPNLEIGDLTVVNHDHTKNSKI